MASRAPGLAAAAAALVAMAGCKVDAEGAACPDPGGTDYCPSGQACGVDLRCSVAATRCTSMCLDQTNRCVGGRVVRCGIDGDPACGGLVVVDDCVARKVSCESGVCACPANTGAVFYADAVDGRTASTGADAPTGMDSPAGCRFRTLTQALSAATAVAGGASTATVKAYPGTYASAGGESFPLDVAARVTLTSAQATPSPVIAFDDANAAAAVRLHAGAALAGFVVQNAVARPGAADAIALACDGLSRPAVSATALRGDFQGAPALSNGVQVGEGCSLDLSDVQISGMEVAGISIAGTVAGGTVTATSGQISGNGEGVDLSCGALSLEGVHVESNASAGIVAWAPNCQASSIAVRNCVVTGNQGGGVQLFNNASVEISGNQITGNTAPTIDYGGGLRRSAGGLLIAGGPPPASAATGTVPVWIRGNVIAGNGGDQVIVYGSTTVWPLDGGDCSASPPVKNTFACYDATHDGVGLYAINANVSATYDSWASIIPASPTDYRMTSGSVNAGNSNPAPAYCAQATTCP